MGTATPDTTPAITVFSLKVEKDKLARFKEACESEHRSMAQATRRFIDQTVREFEANGEAA